MDVSSKTWSGSGEEFGTAGGAVVSLKGFMLWPRYFFIVMNIRPWLLCGVPLSNWVPADL